MERSTNIHSTSTRYIVSHQPGRNILRIQWPVAGGRVLAARRTHTEAVASGADSGDVAVEDSLPCSWAPRAIGATATVGLHVDDSRGRLGQRR